MNMLPHIQTILVFVVGLPRSDSLEAHLMLLEKGEKKIGNGGEKKLKIEGSIFFIFKFWTTTKRTISFVFTVELSKKKHI